MKTFSKNNKKQWFTGVTVAAFAVLSSLPIGILTAPSASAQINLSQDAQTKMARRKAKVIVDNAKDEGLVAEQIDGYLGFVGDDSDSKISAAVNEINILRKSVYTRTARAKNVSVANVAGVSGEKLVGRAAPGQFVKLSTGEFVKIDK